MTFQLKKNPLKKLIVAIILFILFYSLTIYPTVEEFREVADPIKNPLPSLPITVLKGASFNATVNAEKTAKDWEVYLTSNYGEYPLKVVNAEYSHLWILTLKIPTIIPSGLYSLKIKYSLENGETAEYMQPICINVTDTFPKRLLIGHITDIHLPYGADVLARAIYELNLIHPSLIILTGDLVDVDTISSAWQYAWKILLNGPSKVPIYVIPGNHDHAGDDAKNYVKYCGPLHWYTRIGSFHIIALDSASDGYVSNDQLVWAENILANITDGAKILLFHHPLFSSGPTEISGSWENIEKLKSCIYSSWLEHLDNAKEILRLIEKYNITLILSGHIHREQYNVYNGIHIFETNLPAGGSLRQGDYWSFRLIQIDENCNVKVFSLKNKNPEDRPSSYPLGYLTYYYTPANDGSTRSVSIKVFNGINAELNPLIEFVVNGSIPFENYRFIPQPPSNYSVVNLDGKYLVRFRVNIPAKSEYLLTLSAENDSVKPEATVTSSLQNNNKTLSLSISAADSGWGVKNVSLSYYFGLNSGRYSPTIHNVPSLKPKVKADRTEIKSTYDQLDYNYKISIPPNALNVTYTVYVEDFAGNIRIINGTVIVKSEVPSPSPPPPPPSEGGTLPSTMPLETIMIIATVIVIGAIVIILLRTRKFHG
ncbi:MAG: hypothetical protein DRJ30_02870 [Candidatus Methanomethylicota archaeon]|nr:MAG: hypothetical protein DRJ30_02870 [Candidatus Verstraetearchaeota archaeon]